MKKKHGGKRKGSGAKKKPRTKTISIRVPEIHYDKLFPKTKNYVKMRLIDLSKNK